MIATRAYDFSWSYIVSFCFWLIRITKEVNLRKSRSKMGHQQFPLSKWVLVKLDHNHNFHFCRDVVSLRSEAMPHWNFWIKKVKPFVISEILYFQPNGIGKGQSVMSTFFKMSNIYPKSYQRKYENPQGILSSIPPYPSLFSSKGQPPTPTVRKGKFPS